MCGKMADVGLNISFAFTATAKIFEIFLALTGDVLGLCRIRKTTEINSICGCRGKH